MLHLGRICFYIPGLPGQKSTGYGFIKDMGISGTMEDGMDHFFHVSDIWMPKPGIHHTTVDFEVMENGQPYFIPKAGQLVAFSPDIDENERRVALLVCPASDYLRAFLDCRLSEKYHPTKAFELAISWVTNYPLDEHVAEPQFRAMANVTLQIVHNVKRLFDQGLIWEWRMQVICLDYAAGVHYEMEGDLEAAWLHLKRAFGAGYQTILNPEGTFPPKE